MLKYVYIGFFLIVIAGMWMIFHFGIQPRSIRVIKPSYFESPTSAGELVHKVLYPRVALHNLITWGVRLQDSTNLQMLDGFLKGAQASERPFSAVIFLGVHRELTSNHANIEFVDAVLGGSSLTRILGSCLDKNKRVLLVLNALDGAHFGEESETVFQEKALNLKAISVLSLPLVAVEGDTSAQIEECRLPTKGEKFVQTLGCLQQRQNKFIISKQLLNKNKFEKDRFTVVMDQEGERDYVLYFHQKP